MTAVHEDSVYRSKVDPGFAALLGGTFLLGLWLSFRAVAAGSFFLAALLVLGLGFVATVMFPTRYILTPAELVVQAGLLRSRIPLEQIRRVYPHRSLLASPALSRDRLAVEYRAGRHERPTVWISPHDKHRFLEEIARAAGLVARGSELIRSDEVGE